MFTANNRRLVNESYLESSISSYMDQESNMNSSLLSPPAFLAVSVSFAIPNQFISSDIL